MEILLSLQRLVEHFAAATMSIQQSRCFDGVCVVVSGCMAAVSDVMMRVLAVDAPLEACSQLCGKTVLGKQLGSPGFGISTGTFATQVGIYCTCLYDLICTLFLFQCTSNVIGVKWLEYGDIL